MTALFLLEVLCQGGLWIWTCWPGRTWPPGSVGQNCSAVSLPPRTLLPGLVGVDGSSGRCPKRFLFIQCLHDFSFCVGGAAVCQAGGGGGWEDLQQQPHAPHS